LFFIQVMEKLRAYASKQGKDVVFPREILWLGGAPGAGKGTNTAFIMKERHLTAKPIVVSDLLDSPEARAAKVCTRVLRRNTVVLCEYQPALAALSLAPLAAA
jgi:hypothetical protein